MEMQLMKPPMSASSTLKQDMFFNGAQEIGSIDSSDTYASCTTQPFNSQADLTEDNVCDSMMDNSNVYINPLQCFSNQPLRSSGASPLEETCNQLDNVDRVTSRGDLNDSVTAKNWRARFQKVPTFLFSNWAPRGGGAPTHYLPI